MHFDLESKIESYLPFPAPQFSCPAERLSKQTLCSTPASLVFPERVGAGFDRPAGP